MASEGVQPLRIQKSPSITNKVTSRPLSELSPMGIRRNSPKFDQATKKPFGVDSSPFEPSPAPTKSPRTFWQGRGADSPTHNENAEISAVSRSGARRPSLERLQKSSRVKNSNMFARENSTIYDPDSSVSLPERPLATGRPLSVQYSGNNWASSPASSPRKGHGHARADSQTQVPILSPSKEASSLPTSPSKHPYSPQKSSLSQRYPDDDHTGSSTPRGSQQSKSVAFDTAPPQINEYEMITPDPSSIASGSREGSYDLDEFDADDSYEEEMRHHEDSFDESLEDTGKTPVVLPEDWRFMSPKNAHKELAETFDDPFDDEDQPNSPLGHRSGLRRDVSDVSNSESVNSDGERRPLPPLPGRLDASPRHSKLKSTSPRHEPSPPRPASMSKAELLSMRNSPMPLDERLRLLALQENRPSANQDHMSGEPGPEETDEAEANDDDDYDDDEAPHISRESILRKIKSQREASDDGSSDATVEGPQYHSSYADLDPDVAIPSRENSDYNNLGGDAEIQIKEEEQDDDGPGAHLASYAPYYQADETSPARSDFDFDESVIHHNVPETARFAFGLEQHDEDDEDKFVSDEQDEPVESIEQASAGLSVPDADTSRISLPEFTAFGSDEDDFGSGLREYFSPPPTTSTPLALSSSHSSSQSKAEASTEAVAPAHGADDVPEQTVSGSTDDASASSAAPPSTATAKEPVHEEEASALDPPEAFSYQQRREEASTPDSVIHHALEYDEYELQRESSAEPIPEPQATVRAPGGKLKTRASNTVAELQNLRAAAFGSDESASDESRPGSGSSNSLQVDSELDVEQSAELKRQLSDKMKLDLQVGDELGSGLEKEFDRLAEAQKRGYLMRQNTKVVIASHRQVSDEKKADAKGPASPSRKEFAQAPPTRKASTSKTWTTEPWNGRMRRQSSRRSNIGVATGPVPPLPGHESNALPSLAETSLLEEQEDGVERGRLFVKVVGVKNLELPLPRGERSWFQLTLDNGLHCVTTAWLELGKNAPVGQEFELTVFGELDFSLTLQTKELERPKSSSSSVDSMVNKSPNKKPSAFSRLLSSPKKRRENEKKQEEQARQKDAAAAQRANPRPTAWDLLHEIVGSDGSFGRAVVSLEDHEQQAFGRQHTVDIPCFNSWATEDIQTTRSKHGGVQRKPPYKIGELELQLLYIPKPKGVEDKDMPTSMSSCLRAIKEAEAAASRQHEGFLSQQGGDCPYWRRRFFRLDGSNLTSYHEHTRQRRANINLAKATKLIDEKSSLQQPGGPMGKGNKARRRSAFAEEEEGYMFIEEGFRMRFANGEVIDFYADSVAEKDVWMQVLADAVGKESAASKVSWTTPVLARRKLRGDSSVASKSTTGAKAGSRSVPSSPQKQQQRARPDSMLYEKPLPVERSEKFPSARPSSKQSNSSATSPGKTSAIPKPAVASSPSKITAPPSPSKSTAAASPSKAVPALTKDKGGSTARANNSGRRAAVRSMVF